MAVIDIKGMGNRVKEIREGKKLTQKELGIKINSSKSLIAQVENGEKNMSLNFAFAIANEFNVSLDYLYGFTDSNTITPADEIKVLEKYFRIIPSTKTFEVNKKVIDYLEELENPYKIKCEANGLPDDIFKKWIQQIEDAFNSKMESNDGKMLKYRFISESEYEDWKEYTGLS